MKAQKEYNEGVTEVFIIFRGICKVMSKIILPFSYNIVSNTCLGTNVLSEKIQEICQLKVEASHWVNASSKSTTKTENFNGLCSSPADIYMFKVNNRNTRTRCEICSLLLTSNIFQTLF